MNSKNTVIEVKNLRKKFKKFVAVDNISFLVREGEIVGLLGPNGAGKTTTIQMLLGLVTPSSGTINIFGGNLKENREKILQRVNFSSTYTNLPWRLTVWENLYVVALLYSVDKPMEKIKEIVRLMRLEEIENKIINDLSTGQITRVNLARAFLNTPSLILLDEPTASLDPESAYDIRREIILYTKKYNATILWTSHNMAEVEEVCDRVIFLNRGKIVAEDTPRGLAKTIKFCRVSLIIDSRYTQFLKIIKEKRWKLLSSEKFTSIELVEDDISKLMQLLIKERIHYSEITIDKPTLEDYFISMAKNKNDKRSS